MFDYEICKEEFDATGNVCTDVQELSTACTIREAEREKRRLQRERPNDIITIRQYKETKNEERHLVMVFE